VVVLGLSPKFEGEQGESALNPGGDRRDLELPGVQQQLLQAVVATGKPTVLVLTGGSALGIEWAKAHVPAILVAWYPGEEGGSAVADVLFGDYNPAGRLPVTFYRSVQDLPAFEDYAMAGRTYRYFRGEPTYDFGAGRSFTSFAYGDLRVTPGRGEARAGFQVGVEVANTGARAGDEVVQVYLTDEAASAPVPIRALVGFRRLALAPGEHRRVEFALDARALSFVDPAGRRHVEPGMFGIAVGGGQPGRAGAYASAAEGVTGRFEVTGEAFEIR